MKTLRPSHGRVDSLTGLRWFAALGVFMFHFDGYIPIKFIRPLSNIGYEGVPFFFLLSGFVLTWATTPRDTALRFYWRRFIRVWPLLAATTIPALIIVQLWSRPITTGDVLYTLTMTQSWTSNHFVSVNTVTWTLSCEAFFYLMFPLLIRVLARARMRTLLIVSIAMDLLLFAMRFWAVHGHFPTTISRPMVGSPLSLIPIFVIGICVALAVRRGWRPRVGARISLALLIALTLTCWVWRLHPAIIPMFVPISGNYDALFVPCFALIVATVALRDADGGPSIFRTPVLVRLGEYSFAFYLVHHMVMDVFHHYSPRHRPNNHTNLLWLALELTVALFVAAAGHLCVEKPIERRLRQLLPVQSHQSASTGFASRLPSARTPEPQPVPSPA